MGVSLGYFTILLIGFLLWIAYGLAAGIPALVIPTASPCSSEWRSSSLRFASAIDPAESDHHGLIAGHSSNEHDANSQASADAPRGGLKDAAYCPLRCHLRCRIRSQVSPEVTAGEDVDERHQRDEAQDGPRQLPAARHVGAGCQVKPHQDNREGVEEADQELEKLLHCPESTEADVRAAGLPPLPDIRTWLICR